MPFHFYPNYCKKVSGQQDPASYLNLNNVKDDVSSHFIVSKFRIVEIALVLVG